MVIDYLENLKKYVSVNPLFGEVVEFLATHDLHTLDEGKHSIHGDQLFVNICTVKPKTREEAVLETHRDMIDIQVPISGAEEYGYTPLDELPDAPYQAEKDLTLYEGSAKSYVCGKPGQFLIFAPQDGHAPGITPVALRKAIFKVKA